jgi:exosortase/archaeosortase family protein
MGYSKEKRKKQSSENIATKFLISWKQKAPVLFFVGGFCLLMILFYVFWNSELFREHILINILSVNAFLSSGILNLLRQHTHIDGSNIYSPFYAISVSKGCDAIEAMALFLSTTLAFPMKWKTKVKGIIGGIGLLFFINLIRIVTLFFAGAYYPSTFEILHAQIWPVVIIILATGLWIFLIRFDSRKKSYAAN